MRAIIIPSREQIASFEAFYAGRPPPAPWRPPGRPRGWTVSGPGPPHAETRLVTPERLPARELPAEESASRR